MVSVSDDVSARFNALRMQRAARFLVIRLNDTKNQVIIETEGARDATFEAFKAAVPADEPRFAVYDLEFKTEDGRNESKILFIMFSPDNAKTPADRFVYAQSKESVKQKCNPTHKEFQINDYADLDEAQFIAEFN